MNRKAYMPGGQKFIVILLIVLSIFITLYYLNIFNLQEKTKSLFSSVKETTTKTKENVDKNKYDEFTPTFNLDWCIPQEIPTTEDETSPTSIRILGEDSTNEVKNCCQYEYTGFSICLNKSIIINSCITASLGGSIIYLKIDDKYKNPKYFRDVVSDLDKNYIKNKKELSNCISEIYG